MSKPTKNRPAQKLIPFDEVAVARVSPPVAPGLDDPAEDARAAFERLQEWLLDARGRPVTDLAGDALRAVAKALLEGRNGWSHHAEDALEALKLRNGKAEGDDIPPGARAGPDENFHRDVDGCLGALHAQMLANGRER